MQRTHAFWANSLLVSSHTIHMNASSKAAYHAVLLASETLSIWLVINSKLFG